MGEDKEKDTLWEEFASNTSAHGFAHILISKTVFMKVVWILVIVGCNVILYFQLEPMVKDYLGKPIKTKISLRDTKRQVFPAITICNTNNVLRSKLRDLRRTSYFPHNDENDKEKNGNMTKQKWSETSTKTVDEHEKNKIDQRHETLEGLSEIAVHENEGVLQYGHQFSHMFRECHWKLYYDCLATDHWKPIWHWRFGNCFVFNMEGDGEQAESTGPHAGLSLKLHINQTEYLDEFLTDTAGIVVQISDPGTWIDPYQDGYSLAPDRAHYIGLTTTEIHRFDPFKNNSCIRQQTMEVGKRFFSREIVKKYSHFICKDLCLAQTQNKLCGCTGYWLPSLIHNRTCTAARDSECVHSVMKMYMADEIDCLKDCNLPCEERKYIVRSSSRNYPTTRMLLNQHKKDEGNIVKVFISFDTLETNEIIEEADYNTIVLIGGIGGLFGLYNGYSCMTAVEVLILFCSLVSRSLRYVGSKITTLKTVKTNKSSA